MSKTTQKLGQPTLTGKISVDAKVDPTPEMLAHWAELDRIAKEQFNKPYINLSSNEKTKLHLDLKMKAKETK